MPEEMAKTVMSTDCASQCLLDEGKGRPSSPSPELAPAGQFQLTAAVRASITAALPASDETGDAEAVGSVGSESVEHNSRLTDTAPPSFTAEPEDIPTPTFQKEIAEQCRWLPPTASLGPSAGTLC